MKKGAVRKLEDFELHHKIIAFAVIILATILITRFFVYFIVDPNFKINGLELHHFDFGLLFLTISSLLMLFGRKNFKINLIITGVGLGFIIDELWFIKKQIGGNMPEIYNPSFIYVILVAIIISLVALLISGFAKKAR